MDQSNFDYQPYGDPYAGERKGLATAAIICGVASLPLAYLTGIIGFMLGLMAVLFGIFSKGAARLRSSKATAGIITGAIGMLFGAFLTVYSMIYVSQNYEELLSMFEGYSEFLSR